MSDDGSSALDRTRTEVFAEYLRAREAGEEVDIEELCSEHAVLASELRRLHADWRLVQDVLASRGRSALLSGAPAARSVPSASGDPGSEVLKRLAGRVRPIERYRVEEELARGGQGAVLRVHDEDLHRTLAMKVMLVDDECAVRGGESTASRRLGRFLEEAQVTGQLDHPGIVPVHELGLNEHGRVYFTMKLVQGQDLKTVLELVRAGRQDWTRTRALGVMLKVCEAMAYAHAKGVVHRDLKPSNVMVGAFGEVYVMDWGLARVLGQEDRKDLRIQPRPEKEGLRSLRSGDGSGADSPLVTMDGDVVGTPAFMAPEQARGERDAVGPHTDVYSVGAMLYQLLSGCVPYADPGARVDNLAIWYRVQKGPPPSLASLAPDTPAELLSICERAMAREPRARYLDMSALAEDLRAYLEHRVVQAYRTGAWAELGKWVERNRAFAGAIVVALVLALGGAASTGLVATHGRQVAEAKETLARTERANVLHLSAFQRLQDLEQEARLLWPPWPGLLERYDEWLREAAELVRSLDPDPLTGDIGHRSRLAELEARAVPPPAPDGTAELRTHPRFPELEARRAELAALERAQAVRAGTATIEIPDLAERALPDDASELEAIARPLVDPERTIFGEEALGLALAQRAIERVEDDARAARIGQTLAWALFANGLDEEALDESAASLAATPEELRAEIARSDARLQTAVEAARSGALDERMATLRRSADALLHEVVTHRPVRFATEEDRWWHAQLAALVAAIEAFDAPETGLVRGLSPTDGWGIERRRDWARTVEERTVTGPEAARRWGEAVASIADEDECPAYHGLHLEPQLGLVPLGRDPDSGLWEFGHPLSGPLPERGADGRLVLAEDSGLVFVLVPGGAFAMGAQARDPSAPNHDPMAGQDEDPVHEVRLSPFFLSKFEMTQAQWLHFAGANPSMEVPPGRAESLRNPVENLDWSECTEVCRRFGLLLPSEAQWEYAARAGTATVWWTGNDRSSLVGAANLADQAAARQGATWSDIQDWPELMDGYPVHAPGERLAANPFGLHGVPGNVWEWCRDGYDENYYARSAYVDPVCATTASPTRVIRGGSFDARAWFARSAARGRTAPGTKLGVMGLRPARAVFDEGRPRG